MLMMLQLFFIDSGSTPTNFPIALPARGSDSALSDPEDQPAWIDSDDERLVVSLASNPRLRKLRNTESEDLVNGKEYTKRLRRQFERLYPAPEWANPLAAQNGKTRKKKRRQLEMSASSEQRSSDDDMSIDSDDVSTQPLAKLLQNASSLIRLTTSKSGTKRKLRPEVIDIQRLKDVGGAQPVYSPLSSPDLHQANSLRSQQSQLYPFTLCTPSS